MTRPVQVRSGYSILRPSGNSKTSSRGGQKNTYGLLPGPAHTCPSATVEEGGCAAVPPGKKVATCYVHRVMAFRPAVEGVLQQNTDLMLGAAPAEMRRLLRIEFQRFAEIEAKRDDGWAYYRLHWSGDVFSREYAQAIHDVIGEFPQVGFWNYTRSFWAVPLLSRQPNLTQYISLDPVNFELGLRAFHSWQTKHNRHDNVQICYMSPERDFEARVDRLVARLRKSRFKSWLQDLNRDVTLKACPADVGVMPVKHACSICGKCTGHRGNPKPIWFKS